MLLYRFVLSMLSCFLVPYVRSKFFDCFRTGAGKYQHFQIQQHTNQPDSVQHIIICLNYFVSAFSQFSNKRSGRRIHNHCFDSGSIQPLFQIICIFCIRLLFTLVSSGIIILADAVPFSIDSFIPQQEHGRILRTIVAGHITVSIYQYLEKLFDILYMFFRIKHIINDTLSCCP